MFRAVTVAGDPGLGNPWSDFLTHAYEANAWRDQFSDGTSYVHRIEGRTVHLTYFERRRGRD